MNLYLKKENCCGCGACAECCPNKAIRMVQNKEGFYYPQISKAKCTDCGMCKQVCPFKNHVKIACRNLYLGVQALDSELRYSGSSGGIFAVLAQDILKKGGYVYGAGYDRNMKVVHRKIITKTKLEQIRRTKYVQSDILEVYHEIEKDLRNNKGVLFCGTPCQVQALKLFLRKEYEKLILVDLVCYGVPSPGIWQDYVGYLEHKYGGKMTDFSFRDKRNADNGHMRSFIIDEKEYIDSLYDDFFCKMYFRNWIIRPSCHSCIFCMPDRCSDFTIGDFWGLEHVKPDFADGMGTSLVIAHTEKAIKMWNEIKQSTRWFECKREDLIQPRLLEPTLPGKGRWKFMLYYRILPFSVLVKLLSR